MTTDSFVVRPLSFPGGSIGELAVNGTVNDLAMAGARPLALTVALILEEGLRAEVLRGRGRGDRRGGGGRRRRGRRRRHQGRRARPLRRDVRHHHRRRRGRRRGRGSRPAALRPGDRVLVSGPIGDHGIAIMLARDEFDLDAEIESDTAVALAGGRRAARRGGRRAALHARRDARRGRDRPQRARPRVGRGDRRPRGGRAGSRRRPGRRRDPRHRPDVRRQRGAAWSPSSRPSPPTTRSRRCAAVPGCEEAAEIGEVRTEPPGMVLVETAFGGTRVMDLLAGDPLPRIC